MSTMLSRIVAFSSAVETGDYGSGGGDPGMSSAHLLFRNENLLTMDQEAVDLTELRSTMTKSGGIAGRTLYRLTPGFNFMGTGGAAGAATFRLDSIFRMCGLKRTASTGSSSMSYEFRSSGFEAGVANVEMASTGANAVKALVTGIYGNLVISASAGQAVQIDGTLSGLFSTPTNTASSTPTLLGNTAEPFRAVTWATQREVTAGQNDWDTALTPAYKIKSFSLDLGQDIQEDKDAAQAFALYGLLVANRNPRLTVVVGLDDTYYAKFATDIQGRLKHKIVLNHGTAEGRRLNMTAYAQLETMDLQSDVGLRTVQLNYALASTGSDNELSLVCC
jgi:hypothetical protein